MSKHELQFPEGCWKGEEAEKHWTVMSEHELQFPEGFWGREEAEESWDSVCKGFTAREWQGMVAAKETHGRDKKQQPS